MSNTGIGNTGYRNTGDYNSGYRNTGDYNSGDYNSGSYNSGNFNSGNHNSGNRNSGDNNSGHNNSGFFNIDEPTIRLFGKDSGLKRSEIDIPYISLDLKDKTYKEAWKIVWDEMDNNTKERFKNLPNFCPKIFEEITGINIKETKTITIDGKSIEISLDSFEELKRSLIK